VSTTPHFKPSIVYLKHHPLPFPFFEPPLDLVVHTTYQSIRVSRTLDWYGFSFSTIQTTLDNTFVPKSYYQAFIQACWHQTIQN
jgi:hypothetical protein